MFKGEMDSRWIGYRIHKVDLLLALLILPKQHPGIVSTRFSLECNGHLISRVVGISLALELLCSQSYRHRPIFGEEDCMIRGGLPGELDIRDIFISRVVYRVIPETLGDV